MIIRLIMAFILINLLGCSSAPVRNPLPIELDNQASIPGIPHARFWSDEWPAADFKEQPTELFDSVYMDKLFRYA